MWKRKETCFPAMEGFELRKCLLAEDEVMKVSYNSIQTLLFSVRNFIGQWDKSNKSQDNHSHSVLVKSIQFYCFTTLNSQSENRSIQSNLIWLQV